MTQYDNIPTTLTTLKAWVLWRLVNVEGRAKPLKVPYYTDGTARKANNTDEDRAKAASFTDALTVLKKSNGYYTGLGLMMLRENNIIALDFDDAVFNGKIDPPIAKLLLQTYTELSPSGKGVRAFMQGFLPSRKDNVKVRTDGKFNVEFFSNSAFVTVTGNVYEECRLFGYDQHVSDLTHEVRALYVERFGDPVDQSHAGFSVDPDTMALTMVHTKQGWSIPEVKKYLAGLDPNTGYEQWMKILMAVHHECDGSQEAFDAIVEWSWSQRELNTTGVSSLAELQSKWRSFNLNKSGGQITGLTLLKMYNEANPQAKHDRRAVLLDMIANATSEIDLRNNIAVQIRNEKFLDSFDLSALIPAIQTKLKTFGLKMPVKECKKLVVEEKSTAGFNTHKDIPWAHGWVYVTDTDSFYHQDSGLVCTAQGVCAIYNRDLPRDENGNVAKPANKIMTEDALIPCVANMMYLPGWPNVFEFDNKRFVNSYRENSVPQTYQTIKDPIAGESRVPKFTVEGVTLVETLITKHVMNLCAQDARIAGILISFMAHLVQHPEKRVNWVPLIKGTNGDGKSYLGKFMIAVLGMRNVSQINPEQLGGAFTGWAAGSSLGIIEEIRLSGHNRYEIMNALKSYITEPTINIHYKGQESFTALNVQSKIAFTNYEDALPLDVSDRRWFIVNTPWGSTRQFQDYLGGAKAYEDYFGVLYQLLADYACDARHWLECYELSPEFNHIGLAPTTDAKLDMIAMSVSEEEDMMTSIIKNGGVGVGESVLSTSCVTAKMRELTFNQQFKTYTFGRILTKLGWSRLQNMFWWNGKGHRVWVKGLDRSDLSKIRVQLDATLLHTANDCSDLF